MFGNRNGRITREIQFSAEKISMTIQNMQHGVCDFQRTASPDHSSWQFLKIGWRHAIRPYSTCSTFGIDDILCMCSVRSDYRTQHERCYMKGVAFEYHWLPPRNKSKLISTFKHQPCPTPTKNVYFLDGLVTWDLSIVVLSIQNWQWSSDHLIFVFTRNIVWKSRTILI